MSNAISVDDIDTEMTEHHLSAATSLYRKSRSAGPLQVTAPTATSSCLSPRNLHVLLGEVRAIPCGTCRRHRRLLRRLTPGRISQIVAEQHAQESAEDGIDSRRIHETLVQWDRYTGDRLVQLAQTATESERLDWNRKYELCHRRPGNLGAAAAPYPQDRPAELSPITNWNKAGQP